MLNKYTTEYLKNNNNGGNGINKYSLVTALYTGVFYEADYDSKVQIPKKQNYKKF